MTKLTTKNGDRLASQINPFVSATPAIRETCAAICRKAATHYSYSVMVANGGVWQREKINPPDAVRLGRLRKAETKMEALEAAITRLVARLPGNQGEATGVQFNNSGLSIQLLITDDRGNRREIPVEVYRG